MSVKKQKNNDIIFESIDILADLIEKKQISKEEAMSILSIIINKHIDKIVKDEVSSVLPKYKNPVKNFFYMNYMHEKLI